MELVVFDSKIVQIGQKFAEIQPFYSQNGHVIWGLISVISGLKYAIFLKMGSKIVKNHKNNLEMPYKYISDHL